MMFYSGDDFYDDEITSGPADFDEYPYAFDRPLTDPDADDGWDHDTQERRQ